MTRMRLASILLRFRRTQAAAATATLSDAEVLRRYVQQADPAAFELLVWRHERLVWGVCRRLLRQEQDAEDAFQAVFLTLARKAGSIGRAESVAGWLYRVAYRCALRLCRSQRHRGRSLQGVEPAVEGEAEALERRELQEVVAQEVQRLPGKYRAAVVLCYLEGRSYQEAAEQLGCPKGTLSAWLHQARKQLHRRLNARGVALPAAGVAALLEEQAVCVGSATRLVEAVGRAARLMAAGHALDTALSPRAIAVADALAQAVLSTKLKLAGVVGVMLCVLGVAGLAASGALREWWPAGTWDPPTSAAPKGLSAWQECARLRGVGNHFDIHFSPDGRTLATRDEQDTVRFWDTATWQVRGTVGLGKLLPGGRMVHGFSPDGRLYAVSGSLPVPGQSNKRTPCTLLLEGRTGRELARLDIPDLYFCPDGKTFISFAAETATFWDAHTFRRRFDRKAVGRIHHQPWGFSTDGRLAYVPTVAGRGHVWETDTGKERCRPAGYGGNFSPDGKALLTQLPGGVVKLWDTSTGQEKACFRRPDGPDAVGGFWAGYHGVFSPDGRWLLTFCFLDIGPDGKYIQPKGGMRPSQIHIRPLSSRLYDTATLQEMLRLPGMTLLDHAGVFSPDGKLLAFTRLEPDEKDREELVLWDVGANSQRAVLRHPRGISSAGFSPDGRILFAASHSPPVRWKDPQTGVTHESIHRVLQLWDATTGHRLPDLADDLDPYVQISRDGQFLVCAASSEQPGPRPPAELRVFRLSDRPLPSPVVRGENTPTTPPPAPAPSPQTPRSAAQQAVDTIRRQAQELDEQILRKLQKAPAGPQCDKLSAQREAAYERSCDAALRVARDDPRDPAAREALDFVLRYTAGGFGGARVRLREEALALLTRDHLRCPDLTALLWQLYHQYTESAEKVLAAVAEQNASRDLRARAAYLLARSLAERSEMARLIRAMPEMLRDPDSELAARRENIKHLQATDPDAATRLAEEWYERVRQKYADVRAPEAGTDTLGTMAEGGLFALHHLAIGKTAPPIEGKDLDGKRFELSEYRGRVVVLIFCGDWCAPCRAMNPQKQQLVQRHAKKPFALLEINSDDDPEAVRRTMRKEGLTWRCCFDGGKEGSIHRGWDVHRWPTIFVLDRQGVLRFKDLRGPMLDRVVERLLAETSEVR